MTADAYERRREQGRAYDHDYDLTKRARPEGYTDAQRDSQRQWKFDISPERFARLLALQVGRCAVCRADLAELPTQKIHIDHDHAHCPTVPTCGKCVRGIVCASCNLRLRHYEDRRPEMEAMQAYLARPPARQLSRRTVQIRAS